VSIKKIKQEAVKEREKVNQKTNQNIKTQHDTTEQYENRRYNI